MTTRQVLNLLRSYESRNVTFIEPDGSWPMVWERARGVHVWDVEGEKYLDLTAAFGVAAAGHANRRVVQAGQRQMAKLPHAMGDVHPHALKAQLARELSRLTFERWVVAAKVSSRVTSTPAPGTHRLTAATTGKTIFCNSGFEAVEAALKTALLATGKAGIVAFEGAYHGTGYGALNTTHRAHFRAPFRSQLAEFGHFVPFPTDPEGRVTRVPDLSRRRGKWDSGNSSLRMIERRIRELFRCEKIGAILAEPVQGRGGIHIPPPQFLPLLRRLCDEHGALLILDEIYTGFGRTGKWFAAEHTSTVPDLICLGKALTGGFPLSACVGRAGLMDAAWPASTGEAIHTSTFLGHPVGCAMALAQITEIERRRLVERSGHLGLRLLERLNELKTKNLKLKTYARGLGLMVGLELRRADGAPATTTAMRVLKTMLRRGFILLPEGEHANVLSFTPPLTISEAQLAGAVQALDQILGARVRFRIPPSSGRTRQKSDSIEKTETQPPESWTPPHRSRP